MLPAIKYENDGKKAENIAAKFLQKLGHEIIARNFKISEGEIDIISLKNSTIFITEVKQRATGNFKYITEKQMARIDYTFDAFLLQNPQYENLDYTFQLILVNNYQAQILEII